MLANHCRFDSALNWSRYCCARQSVSCKCLHSEPAPKEQPVIGGANSVRSEGAASVVGTRAPQWRQRRFGRDLAQPFAERNPETLLLAIDYRGRQEAPRDLFQKI